jgi:glucose-1-phosphatase
MTPSHPVSLVAFDLDGVLCDFYPARRLDYIADLTGKDPAWIQAAIWDSEFERAAEAGAYQTGEAYLEAFNKHLTYDLTRDQWVTARRLAMEPRPDMLAFLQALRPLVDLAVLTNNGALLRDTLPLLAPELCALLGSDVHVTCDFGVRKPEPLVFARLVEHYHLSPGEVVFVDDSGANVEGARAAGLQGVLFEDMAQVVPLLKSLVGE